MTAYSSNFNDLLNEYFAQVFGDEQKSWNRSYDKARQIFASAGTPAIAVAMQTEHAMLFDSRMAITSSTRSGKLRCATDWVKLFRVSYFLFITLYD